MNQVISQRSYILNRNSYPGIHKYNRKLFISMVGPIGMAGDKYS